VSAFGIVKLLTDQLIVGLNAAFASQPETNGIPVAHNATAEGPATMLSASPPRQGFSVWPYRITRDEFVSNEPFRQIGPALLQVPPLKVDLWFLCTPLTGNVEYDMWLLEKAHQYFYDLGTLAVGSDSITVTFETPGSEELYRLWSALETPYVLSSVFVARHLEIDSARAQIPASRVIKRYDRYTQMVGP
jgi:Pvc16 N-terminal domain